MFKLMLKLLPAIILFAVSACGEPEYDEYEPVDIGEAEPAEPPREVHPADPGDAAPPQAMEPDIPQEAIKDLVAHSSYLSLSLHEQYPDDPEAVNLRYEERMQEVAQSHGLSLAEIDMGQIESYVAQNPELLSRIQPRVMELREEEY